MLSVLGAGAFLPETVLSNSLLNSLGNSSFSTPENLENLESETGFLSRRSSLPEQYIRDTGNVDPRETKSLLNASPTDLGYGAVRAAIERAGITPEQISIIIADCGTPYQVCPSEAQRIGAKLGIKVPAYDLFSSTGPIPAHLETLLQWKEDRVPEYAVLVATNTPTHRINYRNGHEGFLFGDGAAAMVVSTRHVGKLAVRDAGLFHCTEDSGMISFDKFAFAAVPRRSESLMLELAMDAGAKAVAASGREPSAIKFIGPELSPALDRKLVENLRISPQNHWSSVSEIGNTLGSGPVITLANHWDRLQRGDRVVCVQVGVGLSYGFVIFECMQ